MEPDGIEDRDAVRRGRHDPGGAQIPEGARDDLPTWEFDGVGQVLLDTSATSGASGRCCVDARSRSWGGDPLLHRAEGIDRDLFDRLVEPVAHLLRHRVGQTDVSACGVLQPARVDLQDAGRRQGLGVGIEGPADDDAVPRTSGGRP